MLDQTRISDQHWGGAQASVFLETSHVYFTDFDMHQERKPRKAPQFTRRF